MRTLIYLLTYACSIAFTVYLAVISEQKWRPLPFSEFYLSFNEIITIALVLGITSLITISLGHLIKKTSSSYKQFSLDYFNFLLAYTFSILYFLLASSITFNPNLFVYIGVYATLFAFLVHLIFLPRTGSIISEIYHCFISIFKRIPSLYGFIVILLFITPMALAIGFIFSREVADVITEIRLQFNKAEDAKWALVPAFKQTNFRRPMIARFSSQENNTLYILERSGDLYQVDYPSGEHKKLVLDIKSKVGLVDVENGALGLALHPNFSDKNSPAYRDIYIYYTAVHDGVQKNIISKFNLASNYSTNSDKEEQLMVLERTNDAYHNGGSVEFGPDGFLYIALGEGVHPKVTKLANESLRAGIMRIDVDQKGNQVSSPISSHVAFGTTQNYFIPNDNPFVNNNSVLNEYWAMGLRNPFRISFDKETGDLWAGDVGSTVWEEVNKVVKGSNYLYPHIEGPKTADFIIPTDLIGDAKHPTYTYKHSAFDRAVIGGVVYRGVELPKLKGTYLFGDNFSGKIFGINTDKAHVESAIIIAQAEQYAQRGISSITYSPEGEVFVTLLGSKEKDSGQLMVLKEMDNSTEQRQEIKVESKAHVYVKENSKSLFLEMCARCHGNLGDGKGPDSTSFDIKIVDFNYSSVKRSQQEIIKIIKEGGAKNQLSPFMPPWQFVLSDNEIEDLARYIKSLGSDTP